MSNGTGIAESLGQNNMGRIFDNSEAVLWVTAGPVVNFSSNCCSTSGTSGSFSSGRRSHKNHATAGSWMVLNIRAELISDTLVLMDENPFDWYPPNTTLLPSKDIAPTIPNGVVSLLSSHLTSKASGAH